MIPVRTLREAIAHLRERKVIARAVPAPMQGRPRLGLDLADVRGQTSAVDAAVISAAGGHNLLLFGTPGAGKTMLAQRMTDLLPPMPAHEALEVATIHDAAGLPADAVDERRPFRAPHHTISTPGLVGGGAGRPVVGEVTLAHHGVLFLDELPEFRPKAIEALREPLEEREIRIRRTNWMVRYPCRTQVLAAMNLCRCGRLGAKLGTACSCSSASVEAYQHRVSGAILDRFDVRVRLDAPAGSVFDMPPAITTREASARVLRAWEWQHERWQRADLNAHLQTADDPRLELGADAVRVIDGAARRFACGGRTQRAMVRVARTIADLAGELRVNEDHMYEALDLARTTIIGPSHG